MSADLKSHSNYTNEDVAKWAVAQIEATRQPGATLPAWLIGAFENMKRETELSGPMPMMAASQPDPEGEDDAEDDVFNLSWSTLRYVDLILAGD